MILTRTNRQIWCPKLRGDYINYNWYPALGQIKIDGEYQTLIDNTITNKYGLVREDFPALNEINKAHITWSLICELYWGDGKNHAVYKLLENKTSDELKLYVHDVYMPNENALYRLSYLKDRGLTLFRVIRNKAEADKLFGEAIAAGYEGIVLKPALSMIQNANQWMKVKLEDETEMTIVKIYDEEEKIDVEFEGKIVGCKATTTIKDTLREGQTVTIIHNGFTEKSVRNPRLKTN